MIVCDRLSVQFEGAYRATDRADSGEMASARAVDQFSLEFGGGEITGLVGPSGCGKTTLLRVLAGLQTPSSGHVHFNPAPVSQRGELAFVFQRPALMPWLTAAENVRLPLELLGRGKRSEQDDHVAQMIDRVELSGAGSKYPHQLSGGMQMRVSMARALITEPKILLLDEPFSALDEVLREQLGELLLRLWGDQRFTAVMVTHNIAESVLLTHRVVVMNRGHLVEVIENDLPWPRESGIESDPRFGNLYSTIGAALRREVVA